jgi:hypothetical protein
MSRLIGSAEFASIKRYQSKHREMGPKNADRPNYKQIGARSPTANSTKSAKLTPPAFLTGGKQN